MVGVTELGFIPELVAVFAAGFSAGAVNVVVGGGTLVSFPVLVLLGYPPVTATVANTVGIVPGSVVGAFGYRRELSARRKVMRALLPASVAGGVTGSLLLLSLPGEVFTRVVPWLICTGTMLVLLGPTVKRTVAVRRSRLRTASDGPGDGPGDGQGDGPGDGPGTADGKLPAAFSSRGAAATAVVAAFLLGIYGGYFSAAQGILLTGVLGVISRMDMQELNAVKNLTVAGVNLVAAAVFLVVSPELVDWSLAGTVACGAVCGGVVGVRVARLLSPAVLRAAVAVVGVAAVALTVSRG
ncbi:MAG: sulfite exporter TauE/SafE family protein [Corynebacterium provencense]|uniref:sulfite exporter TauE/SafE family protein n=1 Tax=Corynebacterium provencense TaxID=1737425 RepID=UPI002989DECF|nr:sulfite exporter TauE/SafE family protein [Corynebacterium provencense]